MSDTGHDTTPHVPGPSLWPIAFAIGVACLLVGLVISWIVAAIGAVIAVVFGFLWARDVTRYVRDEVPHIEPETRQVADGASAPEPTAATAAKPLPAYTRSRFLEASTLGVGAAIGAIVTLPILGFTVLPVVHERRGGRGRPRADRELPGERVRDRDLPREPEPGRGEPAHGVRPQQRLRPTRATRASRSSTAAASTSAAPCSRTGRSTRTRRRRSTASSSGPSSHSRSAAPATAASTTPRATGRPARRSARSTATRSRSGTAGSCSASSTRSATSRAPARTRRSRAIPWSVPGTHVDGIEAWLYPIVPSQVTG